MQQIIYNPIGIIHTPFSSAKGTPIHPEASKDATGWIELLPEFEDGLKDLSGFSHLILTFHFHKIQGVNLSPVPYLDTKSRGVFATRAPSRPNPIGLSIVKLNKIAGNILHIQEVDMLDGTPLLDIKPFIPHFQPTEDVRIGWLAPKIGKLKKARDDGRFSEE